MYRHDICLARSNEFKFFMLLLVSFWRNFFFWLGLWTYLTAMERNTASEHTGRVSLWIFLAINFRVNFLLF